MNSEQILDEIEPTEKKTFLLPALLMWGLIPLVMFWWCLDDFPNSLLNIRYPGGNFLVSFWHLCSSFAKFLGIVGLIYWLLRNASLRNWMTYLHIAITLLYIIILACAKNSAYVTDLRPREVIMLLIGIFIVAQIFFILNVINQVLLLRKKNSV